MHGNSRSKLAFTDNLGAWYEDCDIGEVLKNEQFSGTKKKKGDKCMRVRTELKPEGQTFSVYVPKLSVFLFVNRIFLTFFSPFPAFTDHLRIG